jgi:DNA repair photolyase
MPRCGSQIILCDYPIRLDTYTGCTHACDYCFTRRKSDEKIGTEADVSGGEGVKSLQNFIEGDHRNDTAWCDWDIPIHIGGLSDPFQPVEAEQQRTLPCLKVLAGANYPFIISTKGRLAVAPRYLKVLADCNVCFQVSLTSPNFDKMEQGAPPFAERIKMIAILAKELPRVVVRIQPYRIEELGEVCNTLVPQVAEAGAHGVVIEGMKCYKGKLPGMEQIGGDMCYPDWLLEEHFTKIRSEAKAAGLAFWSGENRLRWMGDSLGCCGCDDMEGFKGNHYNLNHIYSGENPQPTEAMKKVGTTVCFKTLSQAAWSGDVLDQIPFDVVMREIAQSKYGYKTMGLEIPTRQKKFDVRM